MTILSLLAPAKINLFLEVVSRRTDGYHDIDSVMQTVSLYDRITIAPRREEVTLSCRGINLPVDERNLALRAALALKAATGYEGGAAITLQKNIPLGAGLGGGSSDAAAVLNGLIALWKVRLPRTDLVRLAASLGADVPFFLKGGRARATGIGDRLTALKPGRRRWYLLVNPGFPVATPWVYSHLAFPLTKRQKNNSIVKLYNRLEEVVLPHYPAIRAIKEALAAAGAAALMSGSGATVFGVLSSEHEGKRLQRTLKKHPWRTWVVHSV